MRLKTKYLGLLTQLVLLLLLLLRIKYLKVVIQSKKLIIPPKLVKLKLISENFTGRLAQTNLANNSDIVNFVKRTDFDDKLKKKKKMLLQIKQSTYLLKMK